MATHRRDRSLMFGAIGGLYEAAANPSRWPRAAEEVAVLFNASMSQIYFAGVGQHRRQIDFSVIFGLEYDAKSFARWVELSATDSSARLSDRFPGRPMHCRQFFDDTEIRAAPLYKEVFEPHGIEYRMIVSIGDPRSESSALGVMRGPEEAAFDDDDTALLGDLTPHFRRAVAMYKTLAGRGSNEGFALSALDALSIGIAIVDGNASVLFVNKAGMAIMDGGGLVVRDGHLLAENGDDARQLWESVRAVAAGSDDRRPGVFIPFRRPGSDQPLPATVSHLGREGGPIPTLDDADGLVLVVFTDPERRLEAPAELLERLYGLTPAEAKLLAELAAGRSLDEGAEVLGITRNTARDRLGILFDKTDTHRQAELVRHVLANPFWITEQAKRPLLPDIA